MLCTCSCVFIYSTKLHHFEFHMLICMQRKWYVSLTTTRTVSTELSESKCSWLIIDWQTMQNYTQQTGSAHPNYEYILIPRVRVQHVRYVLFTTTTLAQHCVRQVCLLALSSASLGASTLHFDDCTARAGGSVVHFIFHCALATSQVHLKFAGVGNGGALIVAWHHTWPASYPTTTNNNNPLFQTWRYNIHSVHSKWKHNMSWWASVYCVGGIFFQFPCLSDCIVGVRVFHRWHYFQTSRDHTW